MEKLIQQLKGLPTKIVFADGKDPRVLEAASRLKRERVLEFVREERLGIVL